MFAETMFTGTLIEDLIRTVERAEEHTRATVVRTREEGTKLFLAAPQDFLRHEENDLQGVA